MCIVLCNLLNTLILFERNIYSQRSVSGEIKTSFINNTSSLFLDYRIFSLKNRQEMGHSVLSFLAFRSKLIAADGEHKASRAVRHAAEVVVDSPAALKVFIILPVVRPGK